MLDFKRLDDDYRLEVRSYRGTPAPGITAVREAVDVVDVDGESVDDEQLFEAASRLAGYDGECVEGALDALLGYADELEHAARHEALADQADVDLDLWETAFAADPEAPEVSQLSEYDLEQLARAEAARFSTDVGRALAAMDYAAGGSR